MRKDTKIYFSDFTDSALEVDTGANKLTKITDPTQLRRIEENATVLAWYSSRHRVNPKTGDWERPTKEGYRVYDLAHGNQELPEVNILDWPEKGSIPGYVRLAEEVEKSVPGRVILVIR